MQQNASDKNLDQYWTLRQSKKNLRRFALQKNVPISFVDQMMHLKLALIGIRRRQHLNDPPTSVGGIRVPDVNFTG
jgi:hypothetical protein